MAALACAAVGMANSGRVISAHGVRVVVPSQWHRIRSARDGNIIDPRTLLVVGTSGVRPRASQCQIAAYRIPVSGAAIVVVGWRTARSGGGHLKPRRAPPKEARSGAQAQLRVLPRTRRGRTGRARRKG